MEDSISQVAVDLMKSTPVEVVTCHEGRFKGHRAVIKVGPIFIGQVTAWRRKTLMQKVEVAVQSYYNTLSNV